MNSNFLRHDNEGEGENIFPSHLTNRYLCYMLCKELAVTCCCHKTHTEPALGEGYLCQKCTQMGLGEREAATVRMGMFGTDFLLVTGCPFTHILEDQVDWCTRHYHLLMEDTFHQVG